MSTDVSEVRAASIIRSMTPMMKEAHTSETSVDSTSQKILNFSRVILDKLMIVLLLKTFPVVMEPTGLLLCSQEPLKSIFCAS
jgi:hypothetical protein